MPSSVPAIDLAPWFNGEVPALKPAVVNHAPVVSAQFLKERLDAITVG